MANPPAIPQEDAAQSNGVTACSTDFVYHVPTTEFNQEQYHQPSVPTASVQHRQQRSIGVFFPRLPLQTAALESPAFCLQQPVQRQHHPIPTPAPDPSTPPGEETFTRPVGVSPPSGQATLPRPHTSSLFNPVTVPLHPKHSRQGFRPTASLNTDLFYLSS